MQKAIALIIAIAGVAGSIVGFALNIWGAQDALCQIPGIRGLCRNAGLGGVPTIAQESEFQEAAAAGCDGYRRFIERGRGGHLIATARQRLETRRTEVSQTWTSMDQRIHLFVPFSVPLDSETDARADVARRAQTSANEQCSALSAQGLFRIDRATVSDAAVTCQAAGQRLSCQEAATAHCIGAERHSVEHEVCS
jgi:hypothetical protein